MTYFGDMKIAKLKQQTHKDESWESHILNRIPLRNLGGGICPFDYFDSYLLKKADG